MTKFKSSVAMIRRAGIPDGPGERHPAPRFSGAATLLA